MKQKWSGDVLARDRIGIGNGGNDRWQTSLDIGLKGRTISTINEQTKP